METTKGQPEMIRCGYCGELETLAQARECARIDALVMDDLPAEPRHLGEGHRLEVWG